MGLAAGTLGRRDAGRPSFEEDKEKRSDEIDSIWSGGCDNQGIGG
jgi:uncharacterized protein YcsI (UPF0317 family)